MDILEQIGRERRRQNLQWGGARHDDKHSPAEWLQILIKHAGILAAILLDAPEEDGEDDVRDRLIKIAAIAMAWIEWIDRRLEKGV